MRAPLFAVALAAALLPAPSYAEPAVTERTVTFTVTNHNRTLVPCVADGGSYQVSGRLVGPVGETPLRQVTVYVHDISTGGWFWHFDGSPRHDFVGRLAQQGHVSLVIDRLGYAGSPLANGYATCFGAQATMLHQVVQQVRAGTYAGSPGPARSVLTAGHSVGAAITQLEAATFRDVDGLVVMSWSEAGVSPRAVQEAVTQSQHCLLGAGYAYYGQTPEVWRSLLFHSASAQVQLAATAGRSADPCGDVLSLAQTTAVTAVLKRLLNVPVLLLFGDQDVLNRPDAAALEQTTYGLFTRPTTRVFAGSGGALPFEASVDDVVATTSAWLAER